MADLAPRWLSVKTASVYLSVTPRTLMSWEAGVLPRGVIVRIRRRDPQGRGRHQCTIRIDRLALDRWLEARAR